MKVQAVPTHSVASPPYILTTERLGLRRFTASDQEALLEVFADPYSAQFYPAMNDPRRIQKWIEWNLRNYDEHGFGLWAVELLADGRFIVQAWSKQPSASVCRLDGGHPAAAQEFPSKAVTLVVPYPAGGPSDAGVRNLAPGYQKRLHQTVIIDNVVGVSGASGVQRVLDAPPEGRTQLIVEGHAGCALTPASRYMWSSAGEGTGSR